MDSNSRARTLWNRKIDGICVFFAFVFSSHSTVPMFQSMCCHEGTVRLSVVDSYDFLYHFGAQFKEPTMSGNKLCLFSLQFSVRATRGEKAQPPSATALSFRVGPRQDGRGTRIRVSRRRLRQGPKTPPLCGRLIHQSTEGGRLPRHSSRVAATTSTICARRLAPRRLLLPHRFLNFLKPTHPTLRRVVAFVVRHRQLHLLPRVTPLEPHAMLVTPDVVVPEKAPTPLRVDGVLRLRHSSPPFLLTPKLRHDRPPVRHLHLLVPLRHRRAPNRPATPPLRRRAEPRDCFRAI